MHETVIASSILGIVLESASKYEQTGQPLRITDISLDVGLLSCLEPKTLSGCFEIMAENTAAENAVLNINFKPLQGYCERCGKVKTFSRKFTCPICANASVDWQGGHEMEISSIKVTRSDAQDRSAP